MNETPQSAMQDAFAGWIHMYDTNLCKQAKHGYDAYLVTLRNPLDRLISWYFYTDPRNGKVQLDNECMNEKFTKWEGNNNTGCFDNLDQFARNTIQPKAGQHSDDDVVAAGAGAPANSSSCQLLAFQVASGEINCKNHNKMGYQYYDKKMKMISASLNATNRHQILAIRTEHLSEDWDSLEKLFSRNNTIAVNGTTRFAVRMGGTVTNSERSSNGLSQEGRQNLCRALCEEIQEYKRLLFRASNLNDDQVLQSLNELRNSCPEESYDIRECPATLQE